MFIKADSNRQKIAGNTVGKQKSLPPGHGTNIQTHPKNQTDVSQSVSNTTNSDDFIDKKKDISQNQPSVKNTSMENTVKDYETDHISDLCNESSDVAVITSKEAGIDGFCASVALYKMLKEKFLKSDKVVKFIYLGEIPEGCESLINKNEIINKLTERELVVCIDYSGSKAENVQYSTEEGKLYLKISPIEKHFDLNKVSSKITGFDYDLVYIVGAQNMGQLGQVFTNMKKELNNANKINIDINPQNEHYGTINVIDATAKSLSELVFKKASKWNLVPNQESATALLEGITSTKA